MNYWPCLSLSIFLIVGTGAQASAEDYQSSFTYPDVQITMDFGVNVGHSETIPFKNHGIIKAGGKIIAPEFQGGWQMSGNRPDNPRVQWQFIKKTETGDLYLLDVYQRERLTKEFTVIYGGQPLTVYDRDNIVITFEHPETAQWKAF